MRLNGRDGIARAIYVTASGRRIVVVHAFVKKAQKTPRAALELAEQRAKEISTHGQPRHAPQQAADGPDVKAEYDRLGPIFVVVGEMIEARQEAGLTQAEIASRMGTTQSVVARLEDTRHMPTFDLVTCYAVAIDRRIDVHLIPA